MQNPWLELKDKKPYILDSDKKIIDDFNKRADESKKIRVNNITTPFIGDFSMAKILLLQLNPGSEIPPGLEPTEDHEFLIYKSLKNDFLNNIQHKKMKYPFFWLNPEYRMTGGFKYWVRMFSSHIKNRGDYLKITNKVCCVQYFPYHSKKYGPINQIIKSQEYNFYLVKDFIKKPGRLVILMRAEKEWLKAVPELNRAGFLRLKSTHNPVLTKNNFKKDKDFERFVGLLNK